MKKKLIILTMLVSVFILSAQDRKADIVVLLDTSGTMLPHYTDINERVLEELCSDFVRIGDTFHLLSFAEKPAAEISQRITEQSDIQKIVSRFSLLYPLGSFSDFLNGLLYSQQYIASLDVYTQKVLIIISDGIFNPSKNSPYYSLPLADVENSIQKSIQTMTGQGVYIYYIKAPFPENTVLRDFAGNLTSSPGQSLLDTESSKELTEYASKLEKTNSVVTTDLQTIAEDSGEDFIGNALQMPLISSPQNLGKKGYSFNLPLTVTNKSNKQIILQLDKVLVNNKNILDSTSFISVKPESSTVFQVPLTLPSSYTRGETTINAEFLFSDNVRTNPQNLQWTLTLTAGSFLSGFTASTVRILIVIAVIIACIIVLLIILSLSKKLSSSRIQKENEQPQPSSQYSSLGSLDNASVSTSKLSLPSIADKVTAYSKPAPITIDSSKVSTMNLTLAAKQSVVISSETQKNSADELAKFKQDQTLSLSQAQSQAAASSNKIMLPQITKSASLLTLPSIKSLGLNTSLAPASSSDKIPVAKEGTLILELYVEGQTKKIGTRNIHALSAGSRKSIGGGLSVFSIFFVKVPSNIAEIRYDGHNCSLALLRPEYFPEAQDSIIENCLNVPVKIRSEHGYLTTIMFVEYQSETDKLNNLLLSVIPEEDKKKYL